MKCHEPRLFTNLRWFSIFTRCTPLRHHSGTDCGYWWITVEYKNWVLFFSILSRAWLHYVFIFLNLIDSLFLFILLIYMCFYILVIMSNPIMALLSKDVLTGENFLKWKSNLNIMLVSESIRFILTEERPPFPTSNSSSSQKDDFDRWTVANNKSIAYMLVSISDSLRTKLEGKETAVEILDSLQEMFGTQSEQARIELTRKCTSTRMIAGTPVRDHVMKMTNYFTEAELHGALMDEVTQVGIILNSLSSDFIQFTSNYIMNKLTYGLPQLLNELQIFESITHQGKNKGSAMNANKSSLPKSK
ncbi:MAG: hypothetical protein EOP33_09170, partial [Rickettsiaceae bacterium]